MIAASASAKPSARPAVGDAARSGAAHFGAAAGPPAVTGAAGRPLPGEGGKRHPGKGRSDERRPAQRHIEEPRSDRVRALGREPADEARSGTRSSGHDFLVRQNDRVMDWFGPENADLRRRGRGSIALMAVVWGVIFSAPRPGLSGSRLAMLLLLIVSAAGWAYCLIRGEATRRDVNAILVLTGVSGVALTFVTPHSPALAFLAVVTIRAAQCWPTDRAVVYGVLLGVAYVIGHELIDDSSSWIVAGAAVVLSGLLMGLMRRQNDQLAREAAYVREERARSAALDERARIAREIHDVLAHSLAALSLQLDVADAMLESGRADQAHDSVRRAGRLAKEGMAETRRAVDALRGDTLPTPELLAVLSDGYRLDTGAEAELAIDGTPRDLSPDVSLTLYRTAQEAITNIRKHAPGGPIKINLRYGRQEVELEVVNGPGEGGERPLASAGGGYGLTGLRERAELAGGEFTAGPDGDGWRLGVRIPA